MFYYIVSITDPSKNEFCTSEYNFFPRFTKEIARSESAHPFTNNTLINLPMSDVRIQSVVSEFNISPYCI
ncbi:ORF205 [White spot syndrome virus]|uniref:ORF205 n=1 Tax=White spot syndrome virus TaxID=342409 RepID=A0A2D3I6M2_9VIRU|nr:ORF205 [White spot syndrome virus]